MANSDRMYKDKTGKMFIPMNVEGGSWNEHFMTTPKLVTLAVGIFTAIGLIIWLKGRLAGPSAYVVIMGIWTVMFQFMLRYIVFEERFYYRMYKKLKESEVTTPAIFWDIASMKETEEGALLTYADGKIGLIVKIERDTITGKNKEYKEQHYDAISDFYKEITSKKYSFLQMNIMEQAGNDARIVELDKLTKRNNNENINSLMEKQIGYIKNVTRRTLYESDYILIYTKDLTRIDYIINDTVESVYKLFDGAFIGYRILQSRDIIEFMKEFYGVKYFNYNEATLEMFKNNGVTTGKPFEIEEIEFDTGEKQKIKGRELNIVNRITSEVLKGNMKIDSVPIKDTVLSKKDIEEFKGIDFDTLAEGVVVSDVGKEGNKVREEKLRKRKKEKREKGKIGKKENTEVGALEIHEQIDSSDFFGINVEEKQQENNKFVFDLELVDEDDERIDF